VYVGPAVQSIETRVNEHVAVLAGEVGPGRTHCEPLSLHLNNTNFLSGIPGAGTSLCGK